VLYHPERGKVFIDQDPTVQGIVLTTLSRNQTIAVVSGPGRGVRYYPTPNPQAVLPDTAMLDASNAITVRPTFAAATNGPFTWRITWGDGTVAETGTVTTPAGMPVLTHTYAGSAAGRRVYLRVTDGTGRTGYDTLTVVAKPLGAITTNGPWTAGEGVRVPLTASVADADGETLTFTWSLGNGQTVRGASITARYADNGAYPITLTVSSARGVSRTWTGTATITNTIPVATLVAPDSVDPGALILVILTNARDNGTADMAAGFRYAFDCGGGTLADAANVPTAVCGPAPMTGRVTLRAAIRDKDGGERILTKRVYVRPAPAPGG